MAYWWASQGKNYPTAIAQGSLWTCAWSDGTLPANRALIRDIELGDVVFHYYRERLRAVSVVVTEHRDCQRPEGYPKNTDQDRDDGWLVSVAPIAQGLDVHWHRLAELIPHGAPGPLDRNGSPQQKYLSSIDPEAAQRLLDEVDVDPDPAVQAVSRVGVNDADETVSTDIEAIGTMRVEQRVLRAFLLDGHAAALCGLCGRMLPASLLVAGHIKPRSKCSDSERWDFASAAMLVCALGCDALFERGFLVVNDDGTIHAGRDSANDSVTEVVVSLAGRPAAGHNSARQPAFAWHRERALHC